MLETKTPFKFNAKFTGVTYSKICPISHDTEKLKFKYHRYATRQSPEEQLKHIRSINNHVLVFQLSGTLYLSWGEYSNVEINAGEMFFLPRGAEISGYIVGELRFVIAIIKRGMTNKELDDLRLMKQYEAFEKYEFRPMAMIPQMQRFVESVKDYLVDGVSCAHLHESKFGELYVILHSYYTLADNAELFYHMAGTISKFRDYILDNFKASMSIDELVKNAHMSRSTFDRKFKETFHTTPLKWIEEHTRQLIISKASEPNVTVKDVMYEAGIYNPSQFTQLCKRLCGVTPSQLIRLK